MGFLLRGSDLYNFPLGWEKFLFLGSGGLTLKAVISRVTIPKGRSAMILIPHAIAWHSSLTRQPRILPPALFQAASALSCGSSKPGRARLGEGFLTAKNLLLFSLAALKPSLQAFPDTELQIPRLSLSCSECTSVPLQLPATDGLTTAPCAFC